MTGNKPRRYRAIVLLLLVATLLGACGDSAATATAQATSRPAPMAFGTPGSPMADAPSPRPASPRATPATPTVSSTLAAALATTQRIRITRNGGVMTSISESAKWNLERTTEEFAGRAEFSVSSFAGFRQSATAEIAVPRRNIDLFFGILASSPIQPGDRALPSQWTSITLETSAGTVEFFREIPGGDAFTLEEQSRIGWSLLFAGRKYKVLNEAPQQALDEINPYLRRDLLDTLFQDARAAYQARPTRVPLLCTLPSAAPAASGAPPSGASVNIVAALGMGTPASITIEDGAEFAKKALTDPAQIAPLIALLDQPLPVIPAITFIAGERIGIGVATANRSSIQLYYVPRAELVVVFDPSTGYNVQAPAELRPMLIGIFCGR